MNLRHATPLGLFPPAFTPSQHQKLQKAPRKNQIGLAREFGDGSSGAATAKGGAMNPGRPPDAGGPGWTVGGTAMPRAVSLEYASVQARDASRMR